MSQFELWYPRRHSHIEYQGRKRRTNAWFAVQPRFAVVAALEVVLAVVVVIVVRRAGHISVYGEMYIKLASSQHCHDSCSTRKSQNLFKDLQHGGPHRQIDAGREHRAKQVLGCSPCCPCFRAIPQNCTTTEQGAKTFLRSRLFLIGVSDSDVLQNFSDCRPVMPTLIPGKSKVLDDVPRPKLTSCHMNN